MNEHELEPTPGLPEPLPPGERLLWQGAPQWQSFARRAFHAGPLALYFGVLLTWRAGAVVLGEGSLADALVSLVWLLPLALAAIAIVVLMAWLIGRTTLYTITNRRVVMRIGVVLTVTFNIPFRVISAARLRAYADGTGDIALAFAGEDRIAYLHLWPHARPWGVARPEPMLRSVPEAAHVAAVLGRAVAAAEGADVRATARAVESPTLAGTEPRPLAAAH